MTALFAGLAFGGAMGLVAALGGSHDEKTTQRVLWALAGIFVGTVGLICETIRAIF